MQPDDFERIMVWVERDLSRRKFDGRQIRNVVTSAMGLACADEKRRVPGITIDDLQNVVNYMIAFKTDLDYQMRQYEGAFFISDWFNFHMLTISYRGTKWSPQSIYIESLIIQLSSCSPLQCHALLSYSS